MTPVSLRIERPARLARAHVVIRLLMLLALGAVGCSLYWLLYFALPAMAALLVAQKGGERYLAEDAPRITRVLRLLAAICAYLWLLTDQFPTGGAPTAVLLEIVPSGTPTLRSTLLRLVTSLPALLLLALMSMVAALWWLIGALFILVREQLPSSVADVLAMTLRYQLRLVAYHLSLVDAYPSTVEEPITTVSHPAA